MKKVVSISLGSSNRNHSVKINLLGEEFQISRIGTDGDFNKAIELLKEHDGKVSAIGLGGIDIYLWANDKRYVIRESKKLTNAVKVTTVVDGSGLKNTLEREVVSYLKNEGYRLKDKKVLMVSAVDRFGMAESLAAAGCIITYGDLIFGLKIPIPIRSFKTFNVIAKILLPFVVKMPFKMIYPTGKKQEKESGKAFSKYYEEADIIAGDYLFIRKYMPLDLKKKWILTNTVTSADVEDLKKRKLELLITTTPELEGRSFGTNVMEAVFIAILGKKWEEVTPNDYLKIINKLNFKPRIERLN
ncbi:MAG: quinate 5-dehydrogenase [Actinomycetia bacterium]|nr:quinate 5-dehydrogenase [Actinomycetes bacterium]